jgi:putative transposase
MRGELLKLGLRVCKRTIQKSMRYVRPPRAKGQDWPTFLHTHAEQIWACDFLAIVDLCFRPLFAFFMIELASRKVIHVGVTRHPTDLGVAQQLREATPYGEGPKYLIRDDEGKFGPCFARVAKGSAITILRIPSEAPRANAICERCLGSVRRECLNHALIFHERQLHRILKASVASFNHSRPHQGIQQRIPEPSASSSSPPGPGGQVISSPIEGWTAPRLHKSGRNV